MNKRGLLPLGVVAIVLAAGVFGWMVFGDNSVSYSPNSPKGWLDGVDCDHIVGWTCDADNYNVPLDVHIYADAGPGQAGVSAFISGTANKEREQAVGDACGGRRYRGFDIKTPDVLKDGNQHILFAYALDPQGGVNPQLSGSGKVITCAAPAPVVVSPPTYKNPDSDVITHTSDTSNSINTPDIQGYVDNTAADCLTISGWACDKANPEKTLNVAFSVDGKRGVMNQARAVNSREEAIANICGGNGNRGWSIDLPEKLKDGQQHIIKSIALGSSSTEKELPSSGAPITFTCGSASPPAQPPATPSVVQPEEMRGYFDGVSSDGKTLNGWVCNPAKPNAYWDVKIEMTSPSGTKEILPTKSATVEREKGVGDACGGNAAHGFTFNVPVGIYKWTTFRAIGIGGLVGDAGKELPLNPNAVVIYNFGNEYVPPANAPIGFLDGSNCNIINGWTCDPDNFGKVLDVKIYVDAPLGGNPTAVYTITANQERPDLYNPGQNVNICGGTTGHGFTTQTPNSLRTGEHTIYAYGVDPKSGALAVLANSGGEQNKFNCGSTNNAGTEITNSNSGTNAGSGSGASGNDNLPKTPSIIGAVENAAGDCTIISGWACDAGNPSRNIEIAFNVDGARGVIDRVDAKDARDDSIGAQCGNDKNRGWSLTLPAKFKDGKQHIIKPVAISGSDEKEIGSASFTCSNIVKDVSEVTGKKVNGAKCDSGDDCKSGVCEKKWYEKLLLWKGKCGGSGAGFPDPYRRKQSNPPLDVGVGTTKLPNPHLY